jgi:predicted neutral ceramidase superfamily lipid hydrolase
MPTISLETATLLLRIAFLAGALTDGLAIIPMVSRRVASAVFGGKVSEDNVAYQYAMGIGSSLMAGWTLLLLWGAANPIERRDLLLLTVFPVVAGIVFATVIAVRNRVVSLSRVLPLWIHLSVVSLFYIMAFVLSLPFTK